MDASTKISDLKELIGDFCRARDWDAFHGPKDLAIGACTESAELLEIFRFLSDEECKALFSDKKRGRTLLMNWQMSSSLYYALLRSMTLTCRQPFLKK